MQTNEGNDAADKDLFSKISWQLLPLLIACYIVAFIDRINLGFAQLQMKQLLNFSDAAYAFGAGVFFIGYFLFEVPSNLMLERVGARKTLLRIMFCWGLVASSMMFVSTTGEFYVLRFLLGVFEAGFFPGVILYLTYWYPGPRRGKIVAIFMTATPIAYLLAGPMSGIIMKYMDGLAGYRGWQWLFAIQGLPATLLGIVAFFHLKDTPEQAEWLTPAEKTVLRKHLDSDRTAVKTASHGKFLVLLRDPKIYTLALVYFLFLGAVYVMVFFTPTLIKSWGIADVFTVGMLSAIGPVFGLIGMILIGRSSDKHMERRWHFFFTIALSIAGMLIVIFAKGNVVISMIGLTLGAIGQSTMAPLFFTALSEYIPKKTAAGGIALISSLGNLGPSVMPSLTTWINARTGSPASSLYLMCALWLLAGVFFIRTLGPAPVDRT